MSGNPGMSIGVLHQGKPIYRANYGYSNVSAKISPNSDTLYPIASMSKAMVATLFATLADQGKVSFETKLNTLVPEYQSPSSSLMCKELATHANVIDLLAHRLGITGGNNYWSQKNQEVLVHKPQTARIVGSLQSIGRFRESFCYSNWAYGLAGEILERLTQTDLATLAREWLFEPLGMTRTTMGVPNGDNVARCYMALTNGTPCEVPSTAYAATRARAGAGACRSSINDLLRLYAAWMAAANHQEANRTTSTPENPIKCASTQWASHNKVRDGEFYGLGWLITRLPTVAGRLGVNNYEAPTMPVLAEGIAPRTMIYHQGSVCGALSVVYLLPDTETAVVVLGNGFDLCDTPDYVGQILLEALLDVPAKYRNDYVTLAKKTSANAISHHRPIAELLLSQRKRGAPPRKDLHEYAGRYINGAGTFFLDIVVSGSGLRMAPQGSRHNVYELHHHDGDVFAWDCDRDAESREALYPQTSENFHKVKFRLDRAGRVESCNWQIDRAIAGGEEFYRESAQPTLRM